MIERDAIYIDGAWVPSGGTGTIDVINAATEEVMGRDPRGHAADVDRAVAAARPPFRLVGHRRRGAGQALAALQRGARRPQPRSPS